MSLTILSVAYPFAPVGPNAVGGAEQVLSTIDRGLVERGHRSVVIACQGSTAAGTLIEIEVGRGTIDDAARASAWRDWRHTIANARQEYAVNAVHLHGIDFDAYLPDGIPTLVTLHLPMDWYRDGAIRPAPDVHFHCVSETQARAGRRSLFLPPIPNGVELERFAGKQTKRGFALLLARICPEKGVHLGLEAASQARMPLIIGGELFPYEAHRRYFEDEVRPRLRPPHRWLGPVGLARKRRLLAAARCLLVPSLAEETSSLAAMEALASGTPVVAFRRGALPEIVEHGRTGFVVDDVATMAEAIREYAAIDPEVCRAEARRRFSAEDMVTGYLAAYHRLAVPALLPT